MLSVSFSRSRRMFAACARAACFALTGQACVSLSIGGDVIKSRTYSVAVPGRTWTRVDAQGADFAFQETREKAILSVNSVCGQYQEQSLGELSDALVSGVAIDRQVAARDVRISGLTGLSRAYVGEEDGAPFGLSTVVIRSPRCIYDFVLVVPGTLEERHARAFERFLGSFQESAAS